MRVKLLNIVNALMKSKPNSKEKMKLIYIEKILGDEDCFFKMDADTACSLIKDLGFNREEALEIYKELISFNNFTNN